MPLIEIKVYLVGLPSVAGTACIKQLSDRN